MLKNSLAKLLADSEGVCGVALQNLQTGEQCLINETELFPAASVIKLFILQELFRRVDCCQLQMETKITLQDANKVGGFGILKEMRAGLELSCGELATLMIVLSDNVATNILIDVLGIDEINAANRRRGFTQTCLQRKMMDQAAKQRGLDNFTSPLDVMKLLTELETGEHLSARSRRQFIDILLKQQCNNKLPALLPPTTLLAHKTGDLPQVEHDAGILYSCNGPVIIVVMMKKLADNAAGIRLHNLLGRKVYDYFSAGGMEYV